jgi:hypothetical protein
LGTDHSQSESGSLVGGFWPSDDDDGTDERIDDPPFRGDPPGYVIEAVTRYGNERVTEQAIETESVPPVRRVLISFDPTGEHVG